MRQNLFAVTVLLVVAVSTSVDPANQCYWNGIQRDCAWRKSAAGLQCMNKIEYECTCGTTGLPGNETDCVSDKPQPVMEVCAASDCGERPPCAWESQWSKCRSNGTACLQYHNYRCNCTEGCDETNRPVNFEPMPCTDCNNNNGTTCNWEMKGDGKCRHIQKNDTVSFCGKKFWPQCPCDRCEGDRPEMAIEQCPDSDCNGNGTDCQWKVYAAKNCTYHKNSAGDFCYRDHKVYCSCGHEDRCDPDRKPEVTREECPLEACEDKLAFILLDGGKPSKSHGVVAAATFGDDWASICNDGITDREASILCHRFGYKYGRVVTSFWFIRKRDRRLPFGATEIDCPPEAKSPDDCDWTPYENATLPCFAGEELAITCGERRFAFEIADIAFRVNRDRTRILLKAKVILEKNGIPYLLDGKDMGIFAAVRWEDGAWSDVGDLNHKRRRDIYAVRADLPPENDTRNGCLFVVAIAKKRVILRHVDELCSYEYDKKQVMNEIIQDMS